MGEDRIVTRLDWIITILVGFLLALVLTAIKIA